MELLQISDSVAKFRQALKENPRFLQEKVRQYFKVFEIFFVCMSSLNDVTYRFRALLFNIVGKINCTVTG